MTKGLFLILILSTLSFVSNLSAQENPLYKKFIEKRDQCQRELQREVPAIKLRGRPINLGSPLTTGAKIAELMDVAEFSPGLIGQRDLYHLLTLAVSHPNATEASLMFTARVIWKNARFSSVLSAQQTIALIEAILAHPNRGDGSLAVITWILRDHADLFGNKTPEMLAQILRDPNTKKGTLRGIAEAVSVLNIPSGAALLEQSLIHPHQKGCSYLGALPALATAVGAMGRVDGKWAEDFLTRVMQKEEQLLSATDSEKTENGARGNGGDTINEVIRSALALYEAGNFNIDQLINILTRAALHPASDRFNTFRGLTLRLGSTNLPMTEKIVVLEALSQARNIELESVAVAMNIILTEVPQNTSSDEEANSRLANTLEVFIRRGQEMFAAGERPVGRCNCGKTAENLSADDNHWNHAVKASKALVEKLREKPVYINVIEQ